MINDEEGITTDNLVISCPLKVHFNKINQSGRKTERIKGKIRGQLELYIKKTNFLE